MHKLYYIQLFDYIWLVVIKIFPPSISWNSRLLENYFFLRWYNRCNTYNPSRNTNRFRTWGIHTCIDGFHPIGITCVSFWCAHEQYWCSGPWPVVGGWLKLPPWNWSWCGGFPQCTWRWVALPIVLTWTEIWPTHS